MIPSFSCGFSVNQHSSAPHHIVEKDQESLAGVEALSTFGIPFYCRPNIATTTTTPTKQSLHRPETRGCRTVENVGKQPSPLLEQWLADWLDARSMGCSFDTTLIDDHVAE